MRSVQAVPLLDGCLVDHAEGHHREQLAEGAVGVVGGRVHPADARQRAQPEVPLLRRGAEQEVGPQHLLVQDAGGVAHRDAADVLAAVAALLELLEVHRVVDVGDQDPVVAGEVVAAGEDPALEQQDVAPLGEPAQAALVGQLDGEAGVGELGQPGGDQPHLVLRRQRRAQVERPDGRPGHGRGQRVGGDDGDAAQTSYRQRPSRDTTPPKVSRGVPGSTSKRPARCRKS
jgi:hypothetical protein